MKPLRRFVPKHPIESRLHRSLQELPAPPSSETSDQRRQCLLTIQVRSVLRTPQHGEDRIRLIRQKYGPLRQKRNIDGIHLMRASRSAASLILGGNHPPLVGTSQSKAASLNGLNILTRPRSAGRLVTPRKELSAGLKPQTLLKLEFRFAKGGHGLQWQNLIVTGAKGQAKDLGVQIGWRIYMIDGVIMNTGAEVWQKLQDAMWQWRTVTVVFFTDHRAILMEEKIKEEEEERREACSWQHGFRRCGVEFQVERLAKLPFTSTSDEKHLEQLKQEMLLGAGEALLQTRCCRTGVHFPGLHRPIRGDLGTADPFTRHPFAYRRPSSPPLQDRAITLEQLQRVVDFSKASSRSLCRLEDHAAQLLLFNSLETSPMAEWEVVNAAAEDQSVAGWLNAKGLGKYVEKVIELTDAESLEDFKLLNAAMVEQIIESVGMKLEGSEADQEVRSPAEEVPVQEVIAICIDRSGSMGTPFKEVTLNVVKGECRDSVAERTRMEAVKAMFYAFRDRIESMGPGRCHLGLFQFDNQVELLLDATPSLDKFESIVDDMKKRGQTAIYSSIIAATQMLNRYFEADKRVDLRVLVLTDGQNNSGASPQAALEAVNSIGAVVDAIIVGDNPDGDLRRIVSAAEGECYQVTNLGEGFELLESEAVVSLKARRGGAEKPEFKQREAVDLRNISQASITQGSAVPRVQDLARDHHAKSKVVALHSTDSLGAISHGPLGPAAARRAMAELRQAAEAATAGIHILPTESLNFWRVLMEGPFGSPFEGGVFALDVVIPDDYPFSAPKINFRTPIYHCNVNANGAICLDILKESWSPSLSIQKCLFSIRALMVDPNPDDALRQWIAELTLAHVRSGGADTRYYDNARESTREHASLSVEGWLAKWGLGASDHPSAACVYKARNGGAF
eukprot:s1687_g12.t1